LFANIMLWHTQLHQRQSINLGIKTTHMTRKHLLTHFQGVLSGDRNTNSATIDMFDASNEVRPVPEPDSSYVEVCCYVSCDPSVGEALAERRVKSGELKCFPIRP
jgi:hypothetical protein